MDLEMVRKMGILGRCIYFGWNGADGLGNVDA